MSHEERILKEAQIWSVAIIVGLAIFFVLISSVVTRINNPCVLAVKAASNNEMTQENALMFCQLENEHERQLRAFSK